MRKSWRKICTWRVDPGAIRSAGGFQPETQTIFEERRRELQTRRDFLLPALRELGFHIPVTPEGAFYLYADCGRFTNDSYGFALRLLEEPASPSRRALISATTCRNSTSVSPTPTPFHNWLKGWSGSGRRCEMRT